jgi:hypothetical protein
MDVRPEEQEHQDSGLLSDELVISSLVHEVTRVMHSAGTLDQALQAFLLGIQEITGVQNMILLGIREGQAALEVTTFLGLPPDSLTRLKVTLAHDHIYNSVASHRHILVDKVQSDDPFALDGVESYLVMPISTRVAGNGPDGAARIPPSRPRAFPTSPPCASRRAP